MDTVENEICSICYESFEDNEGYTLECNHTFHPGCIIQWFRNNHSNCPLCNEVVIEESLGYWHKLGTIKEIKKIGRKKNCPANIRKILDKIKIINDKQKVANKELQNFLKDNKELLATHRKLRSLKYKHWRQIRLLEQTLLGLITINPIYIHN